MSRMSGEMMGLEEAFLEKKKEEMKLECPICFEPFDISHNAPLVLWCGHTLCKSCVSRLHRAVLKFSKLHPISLPFLVSCPWCSSFSPKLTFKGILRFPKKNYFVLWMVDSAGSNGQIRLEDPSLTGFDARVLLGSLWKSLFGYLTTERVFRLVFLVIFMALYAAQVSTVLLALYSLTVLLGSVFLLLPELCLPAIGLAA
ncbi:PREDICTED: uncharacterized protein LOC104818331 isoform X2 [Tarenaya hassleriana]|nr:PREDICTED: uncharacterized protein LOC104818331 isoform X2 [Tarenaya hassleriana]XP_010546178.1 PREDICTED: uncharacterized protein LOC104818331 isoform X2 [Tarenaya hassleriana]XP_010546180.1 PREDICTED: uncharacterized protein LOC104818331 isoform X2 [Tarenaya hassleriana]